MVLVIGEILVDRIGSKAKSGLSIKGRRGGAALNVASDLADLGIKTGFYGVVGDDILGRFLLSEVGKCSSIRTPYLSIRKDKETTEAFYGKDEGSFQFRRKDGADFDFSLKERNALPYPKASRIHFGSLFLSSDSARKTIISFIKARKKKHKIISFDVNFRKDIFTKEQKYVSYYQERISLCDIVKFTREEILRLSKKDTLEEARKFYSSSVKRIFVTDGDKGAYAFYKGKSYFLPSKKVSPKDTIGCGDSFRAGALSVLEGKDLGSLTEKDITDRLKKGNWCGKKTALVVGALHAYSSSR